MGLPMIPKPMNPIFTCTPLCRPTSTPRTSVARRDRQAGKIAAEQDVFQEGNADAYGYGAGVEILSPRLSRVTPPVGIIAMSGNGPRNSFR